MKKEIYILPFLLFSIESFSFDRKKIPKKESYKVFSNLMKSLYMHPNLGAHYMLEGDPIEYLFGMIHRNLNKLYNKCGRYPTEKEMPEALLKGEIKKLNCKIDGSLPDWKNQSSVRYKSFENFPLGRISFEEKRFKYFSSSEKFIMTYKAPKSFIERGKKASRFFISKYYENGYLGSIKGKSYARNVDDLLEVKDNCGLFEDMKPGGWRDTLCHIGKRKIIQYKEFD